MIRHYLVVVFLYLLAGLGLASVAAQKSPTKKAADPPPPARSIDQAVVIRTIKALKGQIEVDEEKPGKPVVGIHLSYARTAGFDLRQLKVFPELRLLDLFHSGVQDADLEGLRELTKLQTLDLSQTRIGDAGLAHLKELPSLENLVLTGTPVTDGGLTHLHEVRNLRSLALSDTKTTPEGRTELKRAMPNTMVNP
jgi:Leucine-rich repeat (LRR) protein